MHNCGKASLKTNEVQIGENKENWRVEGECVFLSFQSLILALSVG